MGPLLRNATLVHNNDAVRINHCAQAVSDDEASCRGLAHVIAYRGLHGRLGPPVQRRGGLVEDQDARPPDERPGQRQALALAAREAHVAHHGVVALREGLDELVSMRCLRRLACRLQQLRRLLRWAAAAARRGQRPALQELGLGAAGLAAVVADAEHNVLQDSGSKEPWVLGHEAKQRPHPAWVEAPERRAVQEHLAGVRLVPALQQRGHGALAAAGGAHERRRGARRQLQVQALQHQLAGARGVGEGHAAELHLRAQLLPLQPPPAARLLPQDAGAGRHARVLEDPARGADGLHELPVLPAHRERGAHDGVDVEHGRGQLLGTHDALRDEQPTRAQCDGLDALGEAAVEHDVEPIGSCSLVLDENEPPRGLAVLAQHRGLAAQRADGPHVLQGLGGHGVLPRERVLANK
mmetsp:Transcript_47180/g.113163  ORF Transcript_47180/g.113163 Transcript_47180/m.113163 type:complete len:410 (-) Transcript_47180:472-1701(-)